MNGKCNNRRIITRVNVEKKIRAKKTDLRVTVESITECSYKKDQSECRK